jgi:hypothetical protein
MTQAQANKVLKAASGQRLGFVKVVRASKARDGATHAATETGELACGNKPHPDITVTDVSAELEDARQANERRSAGGTWHDNDLVFCHENGDPYTSDQLN